MPGRAPGCGPAGARGVETKRETGAAEAGGASPAPLPVEEPLIEIWRPHRQHHRARRHETRVHKRHFERREGTPAGARDTATLEATLQPTIPRDGAAAVSPCGEGAGTAGLADVQTGSGKTLSLNSPQERRPSGGETNRDRASEQGAAGSRRESRTAAAPASAGKGVLAPGRRSPLSGRRTRTRLSRNCLCSRRGWRKKTIRIARALPD